MVPSFFASLFAADETHFQKKKGIFFFFIIVIILFFYFEKKSIVFLFGSSCKYPPMKMSKSQLSNSSQDGVNAAKLIHSISLKGDGNWKGLACEPFHHCSTY